MSKSSKKQLIEDLTAIGIKFDPTLKVSELQKILNKEMGFEEESEGAVSLNKEDLKPIEIKKESKNTSGKIPFNAGVSAFKKQLRINAGLDKQ